MRPPLPLLLVALALPAQADVYDPPWAGIRSATVLVHAYDAAKSPLENGDLLRSAIAALQPGSRLEIEAGDYDVGFQALVVNLAGTADDPIWIVAKDAAPPVLTSSTGGVVFTAGIGGFVTRYVAFRRLEVRDANAAFALGACSQVWIDQCHLHHVGAGVAAVTHDADAIHVTRNEMHHVDGGLARGVWLGSEFPSPEASAVSQSVVALNHIHEGGLHGGGIELAQGSYGNWIVRNHVHDMVYPCLTAFGTGGQAANRIEENVFYTGGQFAAKVQGEAVFRNNLLLGGTPDKAAFRSEAVWDQPRDLAVVHNTFVASGVGADLRDWGGQPGMVFANNAVYAGPDKAAILYLGDFRETTFAGNVAAGVVTEGLPGVAPGDGLALDFEGVSADASDKNALPLPSGALAGAAVAGFGVDTDLTGAPHRDPPSAGCYEPGSYGLHYGFGLPGSGQLTPRISANSFPALGNAAFALHLYDAKPFAPAALVVGIAKQELPVLGGLGLTLPNVALGAFVGPGGEGAVGAPIPLLPAAGQTVYAQWIVFDPAAPQWFAFADGLELTLGEVTLPGP